MAQTVEKVTGEGIAIGPVDLMRDALIELPIAEFTGNGVVLVNERRKLAVKDADGISRLFTVSLYISREAQDDDESAKVAKAKGDRDDKKRERTKDEQDKLAREKRAAFDLGQEAVMSSMKNIATLAAGAQALAAMTHGK